VEYSVGRLVSEVTGMGHSELGEQMLYCFDLSFMLSRRITEVDKDANESFKDGSLVPFDLSHPTMSATIHSGVYVGP
jgi:hypothetical protein